MTISVEKVLDCFLAAGIRATGIRARLRRRVHNDSDADDLSQMAFVRLLSHCKKHGEVPPPVYATKIAINAFYSWCRRRPNRNTVPLSEIEAAATVSPEAALALEELRAQVRAAVDSLPPKYAEVAARKYVRGQSDKEIATELGLCRETVKSKLRRALAILANRLAHMSEKLAC